MARNGSGTYTLPAGNPVVTGSTISSTWANNTLNDIATALTGSIAKDGQTTPTGNLPMGGYNHTNVADATVRTQYATAGQVQDGAFTLLTSVSGTNAITATGAIGMSAYVAGQRFSFIAAGTNTGAVTININSIGAKSVTKNGTTALAAGDIQSGQAMQIVYDGTQFQLLNPSLAALGTMSTQNANAVAITGGTITGVTVTTLGETTTVSATAATGTINYDLLTQSVLYYTTNASGNWTLNVRGNSGTTLNSVMATGESRTLTFMATNGSTPYYASAFTIDGVSVTPKWQGAVTPSSGTASAVDVYTYVIIKTASATYSVFASKVEFA